METKTIHQALVAAIAEMPSVKKDSKNPFLKNKYASLDAIIEASKPILAKHGLAVFQTVTTDGVETIITHTSGEKIKSGVLKIEAEAAKGLSLAQSMGVAITYTKRYQLAAMLCISSDEDVDGQLGDNSEIKKSESKPEAVTGKDKFQDDSRPWLTETALNKILTRIANGDDCSQQAYDTYRMKKTYREDIEKAVKEMPNLPPAENPFV